MLGLREDVQNADQSFELGLVGGILWDQRGSDVVLVVEFSYFVFGVS